MPSSDNAANRPRADGSATNWPRNGCASIVWSINVESCFGCRNSSPSFSRNGLESGRRTDQEMRWIGRKPGSQFGRGGIGFLGDARIHHGHQQVAELRKVPVHLHRPLSPGQRGLEQQVGVGADPQMAGRDPAGEHRQQHAAEHDGQGMTAAEINQTDEQADQHAEERPKDVEAEPDSRSIQVGPPLSPSIFKSSRESTVRPFSSRRPPVVMARHVPCHPRL